MAIVPVLDLRSSAQGSKNLPANLDAEQGLLGALLYENETFHALPVGIAAVHFFEPLHGRLFDAIAKRIQAGRLAEAISIGELFAADPAFKDLGGTGYLGDLIDRAPPQANAVAHAETIVALATRRQLMEIGSQLAANAASGDPELNDPQALIGEVESGLLAIALSDTRLQLVNAADAADRVLAWVQNREEAQGTFTGLRPLDNRLGPMLPGDLILVGGRPSMGKSAFAGNVSLRVAAPDWWQSKEDLDDPFGPQGFSRRNAEPVPPRQGVIVLNGEMTVDQMTRRCLSDIGHQVYDKKFPTYKQIRDKNVTVEQLDMLRSAAAIFATFPIRLLKRTGLKLSQMRSIVRRQVALWAREGIATGLVIADHAGLMRPDGRVSSRYEAQTEIAIGAKELADELACPFMVLLQMSRDVERRDDKRPQLADLRDSGGWEENADTVLFPYRDSYYASREKEPDAIRETLAWSEWDARVRSRDIEIIVGKLREGNAGLPITLRADLGWNAIRTS